MILPILYPYLRFSLGTLYPVYKTWKALKRKDETTRRRWMKYWISYGMFQMVEFISDITLVYILPFYYEIKLAIIMWLVHGTKLVYESIINRELMKREKQIDKWLTRINKYRNEIIALVWFELSRCSIRIVTALMSGGLSVIVRSQPDLDQCQPMDTTEGPLAIESSASLEESCNETSSPKKTTYNYDEKEKRKHEAGEEDKEGEDGFIIRHYERRQAKRFI